MMNAPDISTAKWYAAVRSGPLALLLDLDGTLIPFAARAEDANMDDDLVELLGTLSSLGVKIAIATGRPNRLVEHMCDRLPRVWWYAEHAAWQRCGGAWTAPHSDVEGLDELVASLAPFLAIPGTRIESKSLGLAAHWREVEPRMRDAAISAAEIAFEEWLETRPQCEQIDGVEMLEVRLCALHKGLAVADVRRRLGGVPIIAIGDDDTDEDMFAALGPGDLAIGVRNGRHRASRATKWLDTYREVRTFLRWLLEARTTEQPLQSPVFESTPRRSAAACGRLVVVSNRTPAHVAGRHRQVGGLVSALQPALENADGVWLGWSGIESEAPPVLTVDDEVRPVRASIDLPPNWRKHYYNGFCNRALWPLLHGFPSRVQCRDEDWQAYRNVNDELAKHAADLVASDGVVWVHDYHLLLVARAMRLRGYSGPIGLFIHVPFPGPDVFDNLPWADDILAAMQEFDLIGFHTEQWADNFRACLRVRGARVDRLRTPTIAVLPIGIDAAAFRPTGDELASDVAGLRDALGHRRLVLGVDRLDYSKGIPERLRGFESLLERYPEWRSKVTFVQVSVPSREEVPEYGELRTQVEKLVGRINGRFGEADWVPVRYLYRSYDHHVLAQLYRLADVALVTPLRDGLNLVAKEFVAAQDQNAPGVLVLSRFAGAAAELKSAVLTNPFHAEGLAADLDAALRMPLDERQHRHAQLAAAVAETSAERWASEFLGQLRTVGRRRAPVAAKASPAAPVGFIAKP
jgi:alpha,alpha-trehalose-phosphate synthase [UDP-forming]/trehalose-phosphatase